MSRRMPAHNLVSHLIGTGEFSFSEDATSKANAITRGWRDFGNIIAFTTENEVTDVTHRGSYRGKKVQDITRNAAFDINYVLRCDEWREDILAILFRATIENDFTQSALTADAADTLVFTSDDPSDIQRWYDVMLAGVPIRGNEDPDGDDAYTLSLGIGSILTPTVDATANDFTSVAHGLLNGQKVILGGTTAPVTTPAGQLVLGDEYFVVNKTNDDFQLSLTEGGAAIDMTDTGTGVTIQRVLIQGVDEDYDFDAVLSRIHLNSVHTANLFPIVTAPAITATDNYSSFHLAPGEKLIRSGYGRMALYDQHTRKKVWDHQFFSCDLIAESSGEVDGENWSEISLRVKVTNDRGEFHGRKENQSPITAIDTP